MRILAPTMPKRKLPDTILEQFRKWGAKGGKKGGRIKADLMTIAQRRAMSRKMHAAKAAKQKAMKK